MPPRNSTECILTPPMLPIRQPWRHFALCKSSTQPVWNRLSVRACGKGSGRPRPCRDESPAKAGYKEWQSPVPDANARFLTYSQSVFSNCSASPRIYPDIRALRDGLGAPLFAGSYSPPLFAARVPMKNSDRFGPVAHVWIQLSFQDTVS